jgi:hypothetical protein
VGAKLMMLALSSASLPLRSFPRLVKLFNLDMFVDVPLESSLYD